MRPILLLALLVGACTRPVLYYPVPESAPVAVAATVTDAPVGSDEDYLRSRALLLPVAGVSAARLEDSFTEERDGGDRVHRAIDILAPRGTPILSADDGR